MLERYGNVCLESGTLEIHEAMVDISATFKQHTASLVYSTFEFIFFFISKSLTIKYYV